MICTCLDHGSLEVVDEGPLEILLGVDGVWFKSFEPSEGCGFQGYWEVECLGGVGSPLRSRWRRSSNESTSAGLACHRTWGCRLV
jgi:hypothetical protein